MAWLLRWKQLGEGIRSSNQKLGMDLPGEALSLLNIEKRPPLAIDAIASDVGICSRTCHIPYGT
jgi:hypothetical protein